MAIFSLPMAVYQLDLDLRYVWIHHPPLGMSPEQILGKRDDELYPAEVAAELIKLKQSVISTGRGLQKEIQVVIDGEIIYLILTLEPTLDPLGTVNGLIGAALDVTARRKYELEHQKTLNQIEVQRQLIEQREQERRGIARDLHDGPIQTLSGIGFRLKLLHDTLQDASFQLEINQIAIEIKNAVRELRDIMNELQPPSLITFGLSRVIQLYTLDLIERHPEIEIKIDVTDGETQLPDQVKLALFRIYQAAINNVILHSSAKRAWVIHQVDRNKFLLEVGDSGKGFEQPEDFSRLTQAGHFGLAGMNERASAIGVTLSVVTEPGKGTVIRVCGQI